MKVETAGHAAPMRHRSGCAISPQLPASRTMGYTNGGGGLMAQALSSLGLLHAPCSDPCVHKASVWRGLHTSPMMHSNKTEPAGDEASSRRGGTDPLASRIKRCTNVRGLMALVDQHSRSFNYIHAATALHKAASLPHEKVQPAVVTRLVEVARPLVQQMDPRGLASTAWALATLCHVDAAFMGALVQGAKLGSFNAQDLATTAWALAVLDDKNAARVVMDALIERAAAPAMDFRPQDLCQMFQFSLWLNTWQPSATLPPRLLADCKQAWLEAVVQTTPSRKQAQVLDAIRQLPGCSGATSEHKTDDGLFSIDIAVTLPGGRNLAVEVDGSPHFLSNGQPDGATRLRNRLLEERGWRVLSVPVTEWYWNFDRGDQVVRKYLTRKLDLRV
jgi:hypothetical protein